MDTMQPQSTLYLLFVLQVLHGQMRMLVDVRLVTLFFFARHALLGLGE